MKEETPAVPALRRNRGELQQFKPDGAGVRLGALTAAMQTARRMKEWESFWNAVEELIQWEHQIIAWWDLNVQRAGGDRQTKKHYPGTRTMLSSDAEAKLKVTKQQISRWRKWLRDEKKYRQRLGVKTFRGAGLEPEANHGALGTGINEWYTPVPYIAAAVEVMGGIDLDPASTEAGQKLVGATTYFTAKQDGLKQMWHGRVWLNPPYAQPLIYLFIEKLIEEATSGRVTEAIVLTHNSTDTLWFHRLEEIAAQLCFTKGRIAFVDEDGDPCAPTQGQTFFYCGDNGDRFADVFKRFGFIR